MSYKKAPILFLGTRMLSLERHAEILAARAIGYEIIMASDFPEKFTSYGFAHNFQAPLGQQSQAAQIILDYLQSHNLAVSGVISWQDQEEELAGQLTQALGLPSCTLQANRYARNKMATRQLLERVDKKYNPSYELISQSEQFDSALAKIGVPSILKLSGNSGGRGVLAIHSEETAQATWEKFQSDNSAQKGGLYAQYRDAVLLEEFLSGTEHSISGFVAEGEIFLLAITDKRIDIATQLQYENILPSRLSESIQTEVKQMAKKLVSATGINWRGFHIDFMVTDRGIRVLEMGARLGGECINSHLIPLASSEQINPYQLMLEYVVQGHKPPIQHDCTQTYQRYAGSRVVPPPAAGRIAKAEGLENLCEHPNTRDFIQLKGIGHQVLPPTEAYEEYKVAYVIAECPLDQHLGQIFDNMLKGVQISIDTPAIS